ncbi:MAG TPA: hypothetical protein VGG01_22905 [Xanthobacteraceae bacterium]|jgi:hypothetical protein
MRKKLRQFLANATLSTASFLLTYLVCEFVFFRFMLPDMSYNIRPFLPDRADFFMQNSKDHYVPHDYIALLGDSYAAGVGDWLLANGGKSDKPYHSANVIHDLLHRDVASFGRVNIGSAQMMVDRVARVLDDGYCYLFPAIEQPRQFVVYFYEGNDISDNYELMLDDMKPHDGPLAPQIDDFLRTHYARPNAWACHGHFGDMLWRMGRYAVKYSWRPPAVIDLASTMNPVIINGVTRTGGEWQAPPLIMTEAQIDTSVLIFSRSLTWLRGRFPDIPVTIVYVPAASTVYRHAGNDVAVKEVYTPSDPGGPVYKFGLKMPAATIYGRSQMTCLKIRAATVAGGAGFIDARPAFRRAAAKAFIHGPRDWNHPNRRGYTVLGTLVAQKVGQQEPDACDDSWE